MENDYDELEQLMDDHCNSVEFTDTMPTEEVFRLTDNPED